MRRTEVNRDARIMDHSSEHEVRPAVAARWIESRLSPPNVQCEIRGPRARADRLFSEPIAPFLGPPGAVRLLPGALGRASNSSASRRKPGASAPCQRGIRYPLAWKLKLGLCFRGVAELLVLHGEEGEFRGARAVAFKRKSRFHIIVPTWTVTGRQQGQSAKLWTHRDRLPGRAAGWPRLRTG